MPTFNRFVLFTNFLLILLTLIAYIAPFAHPKNSMILAITGLGFPALFGSNLLFIGYWLCIHPKWAWGSFIALVLGYSSIFNLIGLQATKAKTSTTNTLKIASFNMQFSKPIRLKSGQQLVKMEKAYEGYLQQFKEVDVLCLQEYSHYAQEHLHKVLDFPYKYYSRGDYVAIYTKYPILQTGNIDDFSYNLANNCIWVDLAVNEDTLRVYAAHLEANQKTGTVPKMVMETAKEPPLNYEIIWGLLKHYQVFSSKRVEQVEKIKAHQQTSPYPSILCGDMNEPPQSYVYQRLADGQRDTFKERGFGLGITFGATLKDKLTALRIDYIFADPSFEVLEHQIFPDQFSDHYLIQSEIGLQ